MAAGTRHAHTVIAVALTCVASAGCHCRDAPAGPQPTPLEAAITQQLGRRAGATVTVQCTMTPPRCAARMPDHAVLPIALASDRGAWTWRVDGLLVRAQDLEAMITGALTDLAVPQEVACGARVRRVAPDDRVMCELGQGGRAFVVIHADGTTTLELALDAAAGAARAGEPTPADDRALEQMSGRLESEAPDESVVQ